MTGSGVRLPAGTAFEVRVKGDSSTDRGGTLADAAVKVYGSDGAALSPAVSDDDSGADNNAEVSFTPADEGYYYIEVYDPDGSGTGTYTVELERVADSSPLSVDQPIDEDLQSSTTTTGLVAPGHPAWGILSSGSDADWFKVDMAANTLYHVDVKGAADADFGGTLADPSVRLRNASGQILVNDDDTGEGSNARIESYSHTTDETTRFIDVHGTARGSYRVEVTEIGDSCSDDTSTSCSVPVGAHVDETLNSIDDVDWFSVSLQQDTEYTLYLESRSNGETPLEDPELIGVYDALEVPIPGTSDADSGIGDSSRVRFTPDTTGTFFVAAGLDSGGTAGDYRLWAAVTSPGVNVSEPSGVDFAPHVGSAGHVVDGGQATGTITDDDVDVFGVVLEADKTYILAVRGDCSEDYGGSLDDTFMRLLTVDGTAPSTSSMTHLNPEDETDLFVSDDGGYCLDSEMTVSVVVGGLYYIEVSAYSYGSDDYIGTYTVVAAQPSDDCSADTSTPCTVRTAGSVEGALETAGDVDWFSATLTAGRSYRIRASGACGPSDFVLEDPMVAMFDSTGSAAPTTAMATHLNPVSGEDPFTDNDSDVCKDSLLEVEVLESATYYFEVKAGPDGLLGVYSLHLSEAVDECEATTATSCTATLGSMVTGAVQLDRRRRLVCSDARAGRALQPGGRSRALELHRPPRTARSHRATDRRVQLVRDARARLRLVRRRLRRSGVRVPDVYSRCRRDVLRGGAPWRRWRPTARPRRRVSALGGTAATGRQRQRAFEPRPARQRRHERSRSGWRHGHRQVIRCPSLDQRCRLVRHGTRCEQAVPR